MPEITESEYRAWMKERKYQWAWRMGVKITVGVVVGTIILIWAWKFITPRYNLYRATHEKRILVEQSKAERDAAVDLARAEVERAKGVAESNRIIAQSIDPEYLRYLFITQGLNTDDKTVVYVPTEAQLPVLEAERLPQSAPADGGE